MIEVSASFGPLTEQTILKLEAYVNQFYNCEMEEVVPRILRSEDWTNFSDLERSTILLLILGVAG